MKKFYQLYIARNEAGDSLTTAGELIGVSKSNYWEKENGNTPFKLHEAFILARYYNMKVDDLFPETLLILEKEVV